MTVATNVRYWPLADNSYSALLRHKEEFDAIRPVTI
jgi:hypothetical protein